MKPSVEAAAPSGFLATSSRRRSSRRQTTDFSFSAQVADRLFLGPGPGNIYTLIDSVDGRVSELDRRGADNAPGCMFADPVEVSITGFPDETLTMYFQCYEQLNAESFILFGKQDDTIYLFETNALNSVAAYVHLTPNTATDEYPCCLQVNGGGSSCMCVEATNTCWRTGSGGTPIAEEGGNCRTTPSGWSTSNATNPIIQLVDSDLSQVNIYFGIDADDGSAVAYHVEANPQLDIFQGSIAGTGVGFCGAQFASDGDAIKLIGSQDGPAYTCKAIEDLCQSADLQTNLTSGECDEIGFTLNPLGRSSFTDTSANAWAGSTYPQSGANLPLGDNKVRFGPTSVPSALDSSARNFDTSQSP